MLMYALNFSGKLLFSTGKGVATLDVSTYFLSLMTLHHAVSIPMRILKVYLSFPNL